MKYSLRILKNKNLFKRQIFFPKWIEHQIFLDNQLKTLGGFGYHYTIQSLTSRKRYAQKTSGCGTDLLFQLHISGKLLFHCFVLVIWIQFQRSVDVFLTLHVPFPDKGGKSTQLFIFSLLCSASKGSMKKYLQKTFCDTIKKCENKNLS